MKKFLKKLNDFSRNEIVCMLALVASLSYAMYYIDIEDPLKYSLSEIGRSNWALFIVWSLLSGVAILLNVHRLYERTGYSAKLGKAFLYSGLAFLVLTFLNMSKNPMYWYYIHVATAILFAVLSFGSIALCLVYMSNRLKAYLYVTVILFALLLIDIIFLIIYKQMALFESIPLVLCYIVLFFTNFTQTFDPKVNFGKK
ncbi:MAG: hypothetical protein PHC84_03185 [Clostridia bacterium]|nr:hypothetical protein [Clostridia bacterium]